MSYREFQESSIGFERYWLILKRHSLPAAAVFAIVFVLTLVGSLLLQKPVYEAQGKLLFQKISPTSYTGLSQDAGELDALKQENSLVDTQAEVIRSFPIIVKTIAKLELKDKNGAALNPKQLVRQLNVSRIRKTDVLAVVYRDTEPQKAADVVNTVIATYLENNLLANRGEAVAAREFVQKQLPKAESSLRQAQSKLWRFKEENKVVAEARRLGLSSQMLALADVQAAYKSRLSALPKLEQQQKELEHQLQASQSTYLLLLQKLQQIRIAENQNTGNARVIAAATPPNEPIAPHKPLFLVTATLLAGILAVATALLLEKFDKSIRTVEDAKKIFGFPLLGLIPKQKSEKFSSRIRGIERSTPEIAVRNSPRLVIQPYQMLYANLKFLNSDTEIETIAIASSVPKEGKSTVSANLAVAMAQTGRRVLLVDADMHRPLQHKIWELPNNLGLSNIIAGQTEPRTAIEKITANLHVLTSGVVPPDPMALLDSQRMASLMKIFSANYDYTIIDTPALSCAADAAIVGKMTDGMLLVVRPGVVDSVSATRVKEFLEQSGQHVLGQAINGFDPQHSHIAMTIT